MSIEEDWTQVLRSDLAAEHHFAMRPGAQPFGLYPAALFFDTQTEWLIGAGSENNAKLSMSWKSDGRAALVTLEWVPLGQRGATVFEENVYISFDASRPELLQESYVTEEENRSNQKGKGIVGRETQLRRQKNFDRYNSFLAKKFGQRRTANSKEGSDLIWGSWNDGIYREIDQDRILGTASWLKENTPNVRWVQIDDGWAKPDSVAPMSHFGVFYDRVRIEHDPRFPGGMAGLASKVKELGLKPALWLTPSVHESSTLYRECPHWFQPDTRLYFMPELRFLDTGLADVRGYVEECFETVFHKWGFEGCKLDFWTMGFDQDDVSFRDPSTNGVQQMRWFVDTLRSYLPEDGVLLHCIDIPFGSPFRSRGIDAYRYYADSEGSCQSLESMKEQALYAAFLVGLYRTQKFWIPDGDGMGLFRHFEMPDRHFSLWLTFLMGSGTLLELAGWLHERPDDPRLDQIKRALIYAQLGCEVELPRFDFFQGGGEPPFVWLHRAKGRNTLLALTNWWENDKAFSVSEFAKGGPWMDIWSEETFEATDTITVPAQSGKLLVSR